MHREAYVWIARHASTGPVSVLDLGGRDINGSPRDLFPRANPYRILDITPGPGVDIVTDASTWTPDREYDVVVCAEVFEHTPRWPRICKTAFRALMPGGLFIATMAGPGREPHSAVDGGPLRDGEHYGNVGPAELSDTLDAAGFARVVVDQQNTDTRAVAYRNGEGAMTESPRIRQLLAERDQAEVEGLPARVATVNKHLAALGYFEAAERRDAKAVVESDEARSTPPQGRTTKAQARTSKG